MALAMSELPSGRYGAILCDPPWRFRTWSAKGRGRSPDGDRATDPETGMYRDGQSNSRPERHYATMTMEDLKALPLAEVAAADCVLFLWAVDAMIPEAIELGRAWGFRYSTVGFYWIKMRRIRSIRGLSRILLEFWDSLFPMGTGYWTRSNPEQCLLFVRGKPHRKSRSVRKLIVSRRRTHSHKPDEQYRRIEALVDGPYLELFARFEREGWTSWGDQLGAANGPLFEKSSPPDQPLAA